MTAVPWFTAGSFLSAASLFVAYGYTRRHKGEPGAAWFSATLLLQGLWCLFYSVGLLVSDSEIRAVFESLAVAAMCWVGVLFLGFALDYTGRSEIRQSPAFNALFVFPAAWTVLVLTNPVHELVWRDPEPVVVLGAVALDYDLAFVGYLAVFSGLILAGIGVVALLNTALTYGRLYREESVAVAVSTVPPTLGLLVWMFDVGTLSVLNWGVVLSLPHAALDIYAVVARDMFGSGPATQRLANEEAIDAIPEPVVIVDDGDRVVDCNERAEAVFPALSADAIGRPVAEVLPVDGAVPEGDGDRYVSFRSGDRRHEFSVQSSVLVDDRGAAVGKTLLFQDVTDERERAERLQVLNRTLRHNLRNRLSVVLGSASSIGERTDDGRIERLAGLIEDSSDDLVNISEKARLFDDIRQRGAEFETVDAVPLLDSVAGEFEARYGAGTVETEFGTVPAVRTDAHLLRLVVENLLENALEHNPRSDRRVLLTVAEAERPGGLEIVVEDNGGGIPENELAAIREGRESDLEHASGIGLWVTKWCAGRIGASLRFRSGEDGTTVRLVLPATPLDGAEDGEVLVERE